MKIVALRQSMMQCLQGRIAEFEETLADDVSVDGAAKVTAALQSIVQAVGAAGLQAWLEADDSASELIERDGQVLRFKCVSRKEFLTPLGPMQVSRRLYQADRGGDCWVPLDAAWGMVGEFATPEVREAAVYAVALVTPQEAADLFGKIALFQPSVTTLKKLSATMGHWFEDHPELIEDVRAEETVPPETRVVCASLDGANVRLAEPGPKPGRPVAGDDGELAASCFKNAMVGSVTLYGDVAAGKVAPQRLQARYVARMPETDSPTFRRHFEAEVAETSSRCPAAVTRVVLIDGAKALWHYVNSNQQFAGWEKLLDFQHTIEHLTAAADAVFGKGMPAARQWLDKKRHVLLEHDNGGRRVRRDLDRLARQRRLGKAARVELAKQRQFFQNNHRRMTYASFRARGLPIGSGPVEAACKTLVKGRLCRSGMRWTRAGGQHVLTARTLIKSQRWDRTWNRYLKTRQTA
jgi:hypothetical protein